MPDITLNLSDITYNRLVEYARNEAGTTPERSAADILMEYLSEDYERDSETGELLYDSEDGHQYNPDWLNEMIPAAHMERDLGLNGGRIRDYLRDHPELKNSEDFKRLGRDWFVRRGAALKIWK